MKHWKTTVAFLALASPSCLSSVAAQPTAPDIFHGNGLLSACEDSDVFYKSACLTYISGVSDGAKALGFICLPSGVTNGQAMDVVLNGLRGHPEVRHKPSAVLALGYLAQAFPCATARKR
jgi:hypothetical protein